MTDDQSTKVLIVDDETALLESYAAILETRYTVETAENGPDALAAVDAETDVVVLDRRLPEYSGGEVLSEIREQGHDPRVLFCSAVVPEPEIVPMDPDGYLHKPIGVDELFEAIERQLELADLPAEVREYHTLEQLRETLESAGVGTGVRTDKRYQRLLERIEAAERAIDGAGENAKSLA
jgi:DNA-binding NtrC family response regulator